MAKCQIEDCGSEVTQAGHKLCYDHWREKQEGRITECEECGKYKENRFPLCNSCQSKSKGNPSK